MIKYNTRHDKILCRHLKYLYYAFERHKNVLILLNKDDINILTEIMNQIIFD